MYQRGDSIVVQKTRLEWSLIVNTSGKKKRLRSLCKGEKSLVKRPEKGIKG